MKIAILNKSTRVTTAEARSIAAALSKQLKRDACPAWGTVETWSASFYLDPLLVPPGAYSVFLFDDPDVANALGYHDQDARGRPYAKVFVSPILDSGGTVLETENSVSVTASHEALEIFGDPQAGYWAQMTTGALVALELCDPVEADAYSITVGILRPVKVAVSNFVLPAYFDTMPETKGYDFLGSLPAPFSIASNGYQIVMGGGTISYVWGKNYRPWKKALKLQSSSRTSRRSFPGGVGRRSIRP